MIAVPQPSPPILCITSAETTEEKTSTDPIDRSIPEVMMTNVIPTPRTAQTAMFCEMSEKLLVEKNLSPAVTLKNATITTRTPRIHTDCRLVIRLISDCWALICDVDGRIVWGSDNAHASSSLLKSKAPVMAPTNCSTVVPSEGRVTTRVPSRMT